MKCKRLMIIVAAAFSVLATAISAGEQRNPEPRNAAAISSPVTATYTRLVSFSLANGGSPGKMTLVQGTNGNLYGTTSEGGANNACSNGCGTVFEITPSGRLTTRYSFCSQTDCTDGAVPYAGLAQATNGTFYGTTVEDGTFSSACPFFSGCGTVFNITAAGALTTLYSFCLRTNCTDGDSPNSGLVQATDGNLYGVTSSGGANCELNLGCGTVFKITPAGKLTTLYSFCAQTGCTDGWSPEAGLVQAANGNFYGTTTYGGVCNDFDGCGAVFEVTSAGTLTTLHSFVISDGQNPVAGLVQASNGNLYGTTLNGGTNAVGTIFEITPGGTLKTLHNFAGYPTDGANPFAGLVQATNGNFYGTTMEGGANNQGTIFEITPAGKLTTLYSFCSQTDCTDGTSPIAGLVQATNGAFYGTADQGGVDGYGTIFSLSVGLGPFVETLPTFGKVGAEVKILGTNLAGTSSVSFNGTAASFTVISVTEITATVPAGATSGKVIVTTPHGTLNSNVKFRVTQ
ncbi:MAG TPA: choice-of-anchor tandem repeat GloVer-containing protein [Terriglobales bacterium]|nr:choice-of-anchor tandem repeat GloVer-containing protein [Terriglobales bacterium]